MAEARKGRITIGFKNPELLVSLQDRPIIRYKGPSKRLLEEKKFQVTTTIDQNWYPGNIPCRVACPIGTNARGYSRAIAEGRYQFAYLLARQNNPFVSVLGKVCSAPCEPACQRGKVDEPVSIRALKYFAVEKNTLSTKEVYRWLNKKKSKVLLAKRDKPPRIAVVGAGPAGLSAAHDLALMGYKVKVFEASGQPGGMLNTIPSYRLNREDIKRDIEGILFLGIELETNKSCGRDFGINELLKEYHAVLLAPGQKPDISFLKGSGLESQEGEGLVIDPETLMASRPGVFFCGDAVESRNIVEAIASAQEAAQSIHLYLGGSGFLGLKGPSQIVPVKHHERLDRFLIRTSIKRMLPPTVPIEKSKNGSGEPLLEGSYSDHVAREQGERCLDCSISPVIGPYYPCHVCGDCLDVCPTECLSLRFMNKQDMGAENGKPKEAEGAGPWVGLLIDEELCIHCGMCAEACPADAISMIKFEEVE